MSYDEYGVWQGRRYFTYKIKQMLKLKGKYFWNIIYASLIWQLGFGIIFGLVSFVLWYILSNKWIFMIWRGTILFGLIMGLFWIWDDHKEEKDQMDRVADKL